MDTDELLSRCKAGDGEALHLLYQRYKPQLLSVCRQYTGEADMAEDLLHDAFVVILTSLDRLKEGDKLEAWMTSITRHVGYHYREQLKKEQAALREVPHDEPAPEETAPLPDYDQLQSLVALLPEGYQRVFKLSVFEGLSHQEISQLLGIAPHSSSSQLSHAKRMLRLLIRRSWLLLLLLIAIPTALWKLMQNEEKTKEKPEADHMPTPTPHHRETAVESLRERPVYAAVGKLTAAPQPISYQTEAVIEPDSIPSFQIEEQPLDTIGHQHERLAPQLPPTEMQETQQFMPSKPKKPEWNITLAYNGQLGRRDDYLAVATISKGSFDATSNSFIPAGQAFSNWKDYSYYLSNSPQGLMDAETRSLMNIAAQNSTINDGAMEARHEHQLPLTVQLLLSRQLSARLSLETGLSYTLLSSTVHTGSVASVLERQRIHYLGIPLRLGWQWYANNRFSLYSSAGAMLELPMSATTDISHIDNGTTTFRNHSSLDSPSQWSATLGIGLQYHLAPHIGIYLEPSLQYFYGNGSDIQTYRTEHPLEITLPVGLRFRW